MVNDRFEKSFTSDVYAVKNVIKEILDFIYTSLPSLSSDDTYDLRLIFSELLCNAVIHGNKEDITKNVYLFIEIKDGLLFSIVSDEGVGFDHIKLLTGLYNNNDEAFLSECGRGIRLVYSLADSLAFNVKGNQIKFYKKVTSNG